MEFAKTELIAIEEAINEATSTDIRTLHRPPTGPRGRRSRRRGLYMINNITWSSTSEYARPS